MKVLALLGVLAVGHGTALASSRMRDALAALATGEGDWSAFSVTYTDLPNATGGLTLTLRGDGRVEQEALGQALGKARHVERAQLAELAALLLELKIWQQHLAERRPAADEGEARLVVKAKDTQATIWEAHGNLAKNGRILKVRERMKELAWVRRRALDAAEPRTAAAHRDAGM